jgi:phospholipid/cholesterol/gamma-HCH transport system substrate-binding protein
MVGAVVLAGIVLVVFGVVWLKGSGFGREETTVRARFREVGQALSGNPVKLRGVLIGRIDEIELDPTGVGVFVTMKIRSDVRLPQDPVVLLSPESMFGDWQAEISSRRSFPRYPYAEPLTAGTLPGYSLPDMSRLTQVADEIAQNMAILSERFSIAFDEETANNVREAVENISDATQRLTGMMAGQERAINEVATNLRDASQTMGETAETIQRAFAQVEVAVGEDRIVSIVDNVQRTTARTDTLTRELLVMGRDLRRAAIAADSTLSVVGGLATRIEQGQGSLGRMINDTMLYVGLRESTIELQALLKDIRENPRRYITIRVF